MDPLTRATTGPVDLRARVLLVDDQRGLLASLVRLLSGYRLSLAQSAEEAWLQITAVDFDVVVTDYDMPGNGGLWLLEQMRCHYGLTGRILMSGGDPALFAPHVASGLAHCFIYKPLAPSLLRPAVDGCVAARQLGRPVVART